MFHSIECILPPHILKNIAEQGSPEQRNRAVRTLIEGEQNRARRTAFIDVGHLLPAAGALGKNRTIYDAQHGATLPGTKVRGEGDAPVADVAVNEAYDGAGLTYDLYSEIYARNSVDGNGLPLISSVHYQQNYDNAFWDGQQMVYGDGDGQLFNRFTISVDVIGHELTHGVTQYTAQLVYSQQSGALNESMSDVFGSLVKQRGLNQSADQADWLIGAGLLAPAVKGVALRSMAAPGTAYDDPVLGKDPQPAHMKDIVNTASDNGGVHINSGIPNHAFYVVAKNIGGFAWEKAGRIWYKALTTKIKSNADFQAAADMTFLSAGELFGTGSLEQQAVRSGWAEVGITVGGGTVPIDTTAQGCWTVLSSMLGGQKKPA